jgi:hypothetical protein
MLDGSQKYVNLKDSITLTIGDGNDLRLLHNGSDSRIENYTGNLTIQQRADDSDILFQCDDGSGGLTDYFRIDGGAELNRFAKNVMWNDNVVAYFGGGFDLQIYHTAADSLIDNNTGHLYITNYADDKDIYFRSDNGSGGITTYFFLDGSQGTTRFEKNARWQDGKLATFGDADDLQIFHDGGNSLITNTTGELLIRDDSNIRLQKSNGENMLRAVADGEVQLYHNNIKKFDTRTTGIRIIGISEYADNTAAIAGGLTTGDVYRTGDLLKIVH